MAAENVTRKRLETEVQAEETEDRAQRREVSRIRNILPYTLRAERDWECAHMRDVCFASWPWAFRSIAACPSFPVLACGAARARRSQPSAFTISRSHRTARRLANHGQTHIECWLLARSRSSFHPTESSCRCLTMSSSHAAMRGSAVHPHAEYYRVVAVPLLRSWRSSGTRPFRRTYPKPNGAFIATCALRVLGPCMCNLCERRRHTTHV